MQDSSIKRAGRMENGLGERDILEWLYTLTASDQATQCRPEWFTQVTDALEQFFQKFCCGDMVYKARPKSPEAVHQLEQVKKRVGALQVELCQVLYVLKNRGPASEINMDWLRNKADYCLRVGRQFYEACGKSSPDAADRSRSTKLNA